jgi:hypothetical protein
VPKFAEPPKAPPLLSFEQQAEPQHRGQRKGKKTTKKTEAAGAASPPVPALAGTAPDPCAATAAPMGKCLRQERNTFVNLHQTGRWAQVHADVNAAFNLLRKVFKGFAFHAGLTLKYTVLRLSPRLGLSRSTDLRDGGS